MAAPWYIYIAAILVAMPCYILWAIGAYGLIRAVISWIFAGEPAKPGQPTLPKVSAKG